MLSESSGDSKLNIERSPRFLIENVKKKFSKYIPKPLRIALEFPLKFNTYLMEYKWMKRKQLGSSFYQHKQKHEKIFKILLCGSYTIPNFGDRLGFFVVMNILSRLADEMEFFIEVDHDHIENLYRDPRKYDLLIVGNGNSIFPPNFLNISLLNYIRRAERSVGIFGLQYYSNYSSENYSTLSSIIEKLDFVFMRYKRELNIVKKLSNKKEVYHSGDLLTNLFPFTKWKINKTKYIMAREPFRIHAIDFYIREIQLYRNVYSERVHPLLCALCSAEKVAYREQYEFLNSESGKFKAMLFDIFGKEFQQKKFFKVDREKVWNYKRYVQKSINRIVEKLSELL